MNSKRWSLFTLASLVSLAPGISEAQNNTKKGKATQRPAFEQVRVVEEKQPICVGSYNGNIAIYRSDAATGKCSAPNKDSKMFGQDDKPVFFTILQGMESFGTMPGFQRCVVMVQGKYAYTM